MVALTAEPATDIGAVTTCVQPEHKSRVRMSVSVNFFMAHHSISFLCTSLHKAYVTISYKTKGASCENSLKA